MPLRRLLPAAATAAVTTSLAILINIATGSTPSPWVWVGVVILTATSAGLSLLPLRAGRPRLALPSTISKLFGNSDYGKRREFKVVEKHLVAKVDGGTSYRRDALCTWRVRIKNTQSRNLTSVRFPLLGEVPANEDDLRPYVGSPPDFSHHPARLDTRDSQSPSLICDLAAPGLAPGAETTIEYGCTWPGVAHIRSDRWTLDVSNMESGGPASVTVIVPEVDDQEAWGEKINKRLGKLRAAPLGRVVGTITAERCSFTLAIVARKHDQLVVLHLRAKQ